MPGARSPYSGTSRKLVIASDVGTTYSGVSYAILDPGLEPEIKPVTRFPNKAQVGGDAKVPTVIHYGSDGFPCAIGAETEKEGFEALAGEEDWIKAEWKIIDLPPLPEGKTAIDVFADSLEYLDTCARRYIEETQIDGASLLSSGNVDFILSHPNAWEGAQQTMMRNAAIKAEPISDTLEGRRCISFISEGEASLDFCLDKNLTNEGIEQGEGVTIVDAGGGTLDICTYARRDGSAHDFEETAAAQSYFKDLYSSLVQHRSTLTLTQPLEFLKDTRFQEDIPFIVDKVDKTTKPAFRGPKDPQYIKFGNARDRDPALGIRGGQLKLDGSILAQFFEPSIECIVAAVKEQQKYSKKNVSTVFLVGGFAASDYLFAPLQARLEPQGFTVRRPDAHLNKAVPDGAIAHSLQPAATSRVSKYAYGVKASIWELRRLHTLWIRIQARISQCCIELPLENSAGNFHDVFEIRADISNMVKDLSPKTGKQYYEINFDIVILFGTTEFEAQFTWKEAGAIKRSEALSAQGLRHEAGVRLVDSGTLQFPSLQATSSLPSEMSTSISYAGTEHKLVIAFDVGTTYSGISYSILDPGREPEVKPVTRFPSRAKVGGDAKVPSVIYYDSDGIPQAIGAETEREGLEAIAEESQWVKTEWFKLHLRPRTRATETLGDEIPPLPQNKSAVDVFADFLRYLNKCARAYIEETHIEGHSLLSSGKVEFILSHPNSWEGAQQTLMRSAAIQAGLIPNTVKDRARVSFISEGEASLNFCIDKNLMNESIQQGNGVIIVDAGGGTIDVSTYARKDGSRNEYDEIAATQSYFNGSIFVTRAAAKYLQELLRGTRFQDDIRFMTDKFDKGTKLGFRDASDPQYIKFGRVSERDPSLNIRSGTLRLEGGLVAGFFEPSIEAIVNAAVSQRELSSKPVSTVFLVGGFSASDYLFWQVTKRLEPLGFAVYRPDAHLNKAVPDGAIISSLRSTVRTRVARYSFGVRSTVKYNAKIPEHRNRYDKCVEFGTRVSGKGEFRRSFFQDAVKKSQLGKQNKTTITVYRGPLSPPPTFIDEDPDNFREVFRVHADLTQAIKGLKKVKGSQGKYFRIVYDIVILFGATEFKAQYAWYENVWLCLLTTWWQSLLTFWF
ncbi:hypothetical protein NP233_g1121 [Leucocoprinus birnbaumii]|uniref:Uncharacterized protein n=1 Tax=Leucocoprinus birnbaumii TaxID=56174 RepID=A0AAD5W368_9AGAR|nr:hypothetical protein NP233_g1121 [Leucocoprinus birnbaumii]